MKTIAIAALVLATTAAGPSYAASRTHVDARQYQSLVQRGAAPAVFEQSQQQGRTFNAWGHTFTVD